MAEPSPAFERPIDRALELLADGDAESALRYSLPLLAAEPGSALALLVVGHALLLLDQKEPACRALRSSVQRAIDESALPLAVASAVALGEAGGDSEAALGEIARAFGRGSARLGDRRASPPELPGPPSRDSVLGDDFDQAALLTRAEASIEAALRHTAESQEASSLSPQPLFSSLEPEALQKFISIFQVQVLKSRAVIIEEGSLGSQAFLIARGELDVEKRGSRPGVSSVHLARLGAGALVGEMALLSRSPRAATVLTVRPSIVLVGEKEALDRIAESSPLVGQRFAEHCKRRMLDNLVRTSSLLSAATPAERPALVERFSIRTFEPGEKLARQGHPSEGLLLIASGEVSIVHRDATEGTLVTTLGAGDVVGEVALIFRRPAIADAIAGHPTVTLFLPKARFTELVRSHPKVFSDLYLLAVRRDEEIENLSDQEASEGEDYVLV